MREQGIPRLTMQEIYGMVKMQRHLSPVKRSPSPTPVIEKDPIPPRILEILPNGSTRVIEFAELTFPPIRPPKIAPSAGAAALPPSSAAAAAAAPTLAEGRPIHASESVARSLAKLFSDPADQRTLQDFFGALRTNTLDELRDLQIGKWKVEAWDLHQTQRRVPGAIGLKWVHCATNSRKPVVLVLVRENVCAVVRTFIRKHKGGPKYAVTPEDAAVLDTSSLPDHAPSLMHLLSS